MSKRTFDIGDAEPDGVTSVDDHTAPVDWDEEPSHWGRTRDGQWKGYKNGGKVYLDWHELTRRWGPLTESEEA